ncbi:MAG: DUF2333 family protein, partial [Thiohalocapsa sp.]
MDERENVTASNKKKAQLATKVAKVATLYSPRTWKEKGLPWSLGLFAITLAVIIIALGIYWSRSPGMFDVRQEALNRAGGEQTELVPGYVTTATAILIAETLLDKPGGYLSNDMTPPGIYLDNIPSWEFGVLTEVRDLVRSMRNDFSRSQTQSVEDKDLQVGEPQFHFDSESWILPSSESAYRKGLESLNSYLNRLADTKAQDGQFFTRADNLRAYLAIVEKRLGSLAQRLAAGAGQNRLNIDLAGDSNARQSTPTPAEQRTKTPWLEIDDVFFEARGYSWAL